MKYFQSTIERLLYVLLIVLVIVNVAEGLLVYDVISKQNQVIESQQKTVASLNKIVTNHTGTLSAIQGGFSGLNTKVDCIFQYFATPGRNGQSTVNLSPNQKECDVNINPTTSSGGASSSTKSTQQ